MINVITTGKIPVFSWANDLEEGTLKQLWNLANLPFAFHHVCVMADGHLGYGMPIGGVMATKDVIVPNAVGADIGCGMRAMRTNLQVLTDEDVRRLVGGSKDYHGGIKSLIPMGRDKQSKPQEWKGFDRAPDLLPIQLELQNARKQLGTLGSGNHFIEIQQGSDGFIWIMIHSGSRHLGYAVAKRYNAIAQKECLRWYSDVPSFEGEDGLAFFPIQTRYGHEYREAMEYSLDFAKANRALMMERVREAFVTVMGDQVEFFEEFDVHHNYARYENHYGRNVMIHRKGATSAKVGELGIIPGSQRTNSYIVEGLGNPKSFMSCSHGAGRKMSRNAAKKTLVLKDEIALMDLQDIQHDMRTIEDLEEAGGAYKDISEVMDNQADLVKIKVKLTPIRPLKGLSTKGRHR